MLIRYEETFKSLLKEIYQSEDKKLLKPSDID
jgi:hypothetical protein